MRTIVVGLGVVLAWYTLQAVLVSAWLGVVAAVLWLGIILVSAHVDLLLADRLHRAWRRARTYVALRQDVHFREHVLLEIDELLAHALQLERSLIGSPA